MGHQNFSKSFTYMLYQSTKCQNCSKRVAMAGGNEVSAFGVLPEEIISNIISFTSPEDACVAPAVSSSFISAAASDAVWERFLPPDYEDILAKAVTPVVYSSKKELYFRLCDSPLLLDGGNLIFRLSKPTGKKCYMLCARELNIAWADTPMYWNWRTLPESRFAEVAELLCVCWLHIRGNIQSQMLSLKTNYAAYLVFKINPNSYGFDLSSKASVKLVLGSTSEVEEENNTVYLMTPTRRLIQGIAGQMPVERSDGWMEIELGEYFIQEGDEGDIEMQLREIENLHLKGGLIVEGIEIRPKEG